MTVTIMPTISMPLEFAFLVQAHFMDAVVKVYCVHTEPNFSLPWQRKRQYASTSSGFMVLGDYGERWLLTNAHSVEYHSQVCCAYPSRYGLPLNL